jgi:hypothetical protein
LSHFHFEVKGKKEGRKKEGRKGGRERRKRNRAFLFILERIYVSL